MHNTSAIRFASYLSPNMYPTYEYIAYYVGNKVGRPATLTVGQSFDEFATGQVDVGFICGLPYVHLADSPTRPVELLAAPVLQGERYQRKPIYFSDVIVRNDSLYTSFDDLQGCVWAYNQKTSHSGCNLVCYSLLVQGKSLHYFGKTVETGSHRRSVQLVLEGQVDAAAIDSHMLDVFLSQHSDIATKLSIIDTLGPSSIPPVVAAKSLDNDLKCRLRETLITMHLDPEAARGLHRGLIERFVVVADDDYDDIRTMFARVQAVEFPFG
jgi:phosphonate transport system substrate-binding protein